MAFRTFGKLNREMVFFYAGWQIMYENGFPDKLTKLIKQPWIEGCRVEEELAEPFVSRRGLRQGDGLSCALFNIELEGVVGRAGIDTSGTIFAKSVQQLAYADDIGIIERIQEMVKDGYTRLKTEAIRLDNEYDEYEVDER